MKPKPPRAQTALCAFLIGLFAAACHRSAERTPRFENLVIVMIDTLRSDHLPSYGYARNTAPFLTRLAAEGIQVQGYAASSWTRPSIATLLTGLHPQRHQAISRTDHLGEGLAYLPDLLEAEGFATGAFVSNRNVGRSWGFDRGYRHFAQTKATGKIDGKRVTRRALGVAAALEPPFFLYVHYVDPHDPYRPKRPWAEPGTPQRPLVQPRRIRDGKEPRTPENLAALVDQYDGEIREMDAAIERLFEGLEARGLLEDTLVVVTADHGEEFGEHGGLTHGSSLFEEVLAVPFLVWSRRGLPRSTSADRFHQVDFLPTALDALGREVPEGLDGVSRWRPLLGGELPQAEPFYFHLDLDHVGALALLRWPEKLVHTARRPHVRIFDLDADPAEKAGSEEEAAGQRMLRELLVHHNRMGAQATARKIGALSDEERRGLAALGYMQLDTPTEELEGRAVPPRLDRERGFAAER